MAKQKRIPPRQKFWEHFVDVLYERVVPEMRRRSGVHEGEDIERCDCSWCVWQRVALQLDDHCPHVRWVEGKTESLTFLVRPPIPREEYETLLWVVDQLDIIANIDVEIRDCTGRTDNLVARYYQRMWHDARER